MKKTILSILFFTTLLAVLLIILSRKEQIKKEQSTHFKTFNESDLKYLIHNKNYFEGKIALVFFSTNCDLCTYELEIIENKTYPEIDFIFCSVQHADTILAFAKNSNRQSEINLSFAKIDSALFVDKYHIKGYPSYIMYEDDSLKRYSAGLLTDSRIRKTFYSNN